MKIRIELEISVPSGDLSAILEAAQRFAVQLAADNNDTEDACEDCDGSGEVPSWRHGVQYSAACTECDGTGIVERDYDNEMSPESQKVSESVSVQEISGA